MKKCSGPETCIRSKQLKHSALTYNISDEEVRGPHQDPVRSLGVKHKEDCHGHQVCQRQPEETQVDTAVETLFEEDSSTQGVSHRAHHPQQGQTKHRDGQVDPFLNLKHSDGEGRGSWRGRFFTGSGQSREAETETQS